MPLYAPSPSPRSQISLTNYGNSIRLNALGASWNWFFLWSKKLKRSFGLLVCDILFLKFKGISFDIQRQKICRGSVRILLYLRPKCLNISWESKIKQELTEEQRIVLVEGNNLTCGVWLAENPHQNPIGSLWITLGMSITARTPIPETNRWLFRKDRKRKAESGAWVLFWWKPMSCFVYLSSCFIKWMRRHLVK